MTVTLEATFSIIEVNQFLLTILSNINFNHRMINAISRAP